MKCKNRAINWHLSRSVYRVTCCHFSRFLSRRCVRMEIAFVTFTIRISLRTVLPADSMCDVKKNVMLWKCQPLMLVNYERQLRPIEPVEDLSMERIVPYILIYFSLTSLRQLDYSSRDITLTWNLSNASVLH